MEKNSEKKVFCSFQKNSPYLLNNPHIIKDNNIENKSQ